MNPYLLEKAQPDVDPSAPPCASAGNPDAWFPEGDTRSRNATRTRAKKVCARCPMAEACFQMALKGDEPAGIWGGVDFEEARKKSHAGSPWKHIARQMRRAAIDPEDAARRIAKADYDRERRERKRLELLYLAQKRAIEQMVGAAS